jgi:F-type H+-transporting ATPase subunit a
MLVSLGVSIILVLVAALFRFAVIHQPDSTSAALAKLTVDWLDNTVRDIIGRPEPAVATLTGSLFLFIAACNISGQLPGVRPATASLATTSALAIVVFLAVPVAGLRTRGLWGYVKHYFSPNPILFPLHLVSEISRTVALAMRLFGNIMSGHLVVGLLVALSGFLVPMPFMALDLLIGLLQAYIFAVLSTVFIGAAIGAEEET